MIAFDTNHLLRHVLQDDPSQCARVASLIELAVAEGDPIYLCDLVLMETCWVLESSLNLDRAGWCATLAHVLQDPVFRFEDSLRIWKALDRYRNGKADFDDYLILGHAESVGARLETFDKKLKREM